MIYSTYKNAISSKLELYPLTTKDETMKTATLAQAKRDFANGHYAGAAIYFHPIKGDGQPCYTVHFGAALAVDRDETYLVDARTKETRFFKTMDAAHRAVRDVGFMTARFWGSAT